MKKFIVSWKVEGTAIVEAKDLRSAITNARKAMKEQPQNFVSSSIIDIFKIVAVAEKDK